MKKHVKQSHLYCSKLHSAMHVKDTAAQWKRWQVKRDSRVTVSTITHPCYMSVGLLMLQCLLTFHKHAWLYRKRHLLVTRCKFSEFLLPQNRHRSQDFYNLSARYQIKPPWNVWCCLN